MICTCPAFEANIKIIDGPGRLAQARNPQYGNPYKGLDPMRFCAWCGGKLLPDLCESPDQTTGEPK